MNRPTPAAIPDPSDDDPATPASRDDVELPPADACVGSRPGETARAASARLEREARQAAALRANLRRRKQQARSRNEPSDV